MNQILKEENKSLKEYIVATFEVVKSFVFVPINTIKNLIEAHIYSKHARKKRKTFEEYYEEFEENELENDDFKEKE